jgi:leucyl aminopeptidase (aminopeptidase T)
VVRLPSGPAGRSRSLFLPPQPLESLYRVCSVPFRTHVAFHDRLMVSLRAAGRVRVTSPDGTDISFDARPFVAHTFSARQPGQFMLGFPGEVTTAPLEASAEGRLVLDVGCYLGPLSESVAFEVREGRVVAAEREGRYPGSGAPPDPVVDALLAELGERTAAWPDALRVGEFGLGTNGSARYSGSYMEDEVVMGSCHFDFGANVQFGGNLSGPHHGGGVVSAPTVKVDGVTILKNGLYVERNLA